MRINQKTIRTIFSMCVTIFLVLVCLFMFQQSKYSDYNTVNSKIIKVDKQSGISGNSKSRLYYVTYQYSVEGRQHNAKMQVFTAIGKKIGKTICVKYNPQNPSELKDEFQLPTTYENTSFR